jgi:hypothetical protein
MSALGASGRVEHEKSVHLSPNEKSRAASPAFIEKIARCG